MTERYVPVGWNVTKIVYDAVALVLIGVYISVFLWVAPSFQHVTLPLDAYTMRMNEVPAMEVYGVKSKEAPGGVGELGTSIAAPALGNAIFAATGVRLRSLPIDSRQLVESADALRSVVADSGHGRHQSPVNV